MASGVSSDDNSISCSDSGIDDPFRHFSLVSIGHNVSYLDDEVPIVEEGFNYIVHPLPMGSYDLDSYLDSCS